MYADDPSNASESTSTCVRIAHPAHVVARVGAHEPQRRVSGRERRRVSQHSARAHARRPTGATYTLHVHFDVTLELMKCKMFILSYIPGLT